MRTNVTAAIIVGTMLCGCGGPTAPEILKVWPAPPTTPTDTPKGVYPAAWPTVAFAGRFAPDSKHDVSSVLAGDATIFFAAGPNLDTEQPPTRLVSCVRFATACNTSSLRGYWFQFGPKEYEPYFVLIHDSGGTIGARVRVFHHSVIYSDYQDPAGFQSHYFGVDLEEGSRIPPYAGDIDGDGMPELLVAAHVTNGSGAEGTPKRYRVFDWKDNGLAVVREIEACDLDTDLMTRL